MARRGQVIGKGGDRIKTMRTETNCKIMVQSMDRMPPGSNERTVSIQGSPSNVMLAVDKVSTLHPTPYKPYTMQHTPCTLHPTPHSLHPTTHTPHTATYTLHPTPPYNIHPTPYTLNSEPLLDLRQSA